MRPRALQKLSLLLMVAGAFFTRVCKIRYHFISENPFMSRHYSSVTALVFLYSWMGSVLYVT